MGDASTEILLQREQLKNSTKKDVTNQELERQYSTNSKTQKSSEEGSFISIKSLYPYSHESTIKESSINKLHLRKEELRRETRATLNGQVNTELKSFLNHTYQLMELCSSYRTLKNQQKAYSPTKLKQIEARLKQQEKIPQE